MMTEQPASTQQRPNRNFLAFALIGIGVFALFAQTAQATRTEIMVDIDGQREAAEIQAEVQRELAEAQREIAAAQREAQQEIAQAQRETQLEIAEVQREAMMEQMEIQHSIPAAPLAPMAPRAPRFNMFNMAGAALLLFAGWYMLNRRRQQPVPVPVQTGEPVANR